MKKILVSVSLIMAITTAMAQNAKPAPKAKAAKGDAPIQLSRPFAEPDYWTKLLQMKSGFTLMFEMNSKDGMKVTIFNEKHIAAPVKPLPLKTVIKNMQNVEVLGIYEINLQAVVFVQLFEKPNPQLVRVIIDPKTGKLIKEEVIGNLPEPSPETNQELIFGGGNISRFDVQKDNGSDNYVTVTYNTAEEINKQIEVVAYDGTHKETARAFYNCPGEFKYLRYLNVYNYGGAFTYLAVYGHNGKDSNGDDGRFYIARIKNGNPQFKSIELSYTESFEETSCQMSFNTKSGLLNFILLTSQRDEKKNIVYRTVFQPVHPEGFKLDSAFDMPTAKVNEYAKSKLGYKKDYDGVPMDWYLDEDGNYHVLLQRATIVTYKSADADFGQKIYNVKLDDWGYEVFDNTGSEIFGTAFNIHYDLDGINSKEGGDFFRYVQAKQGSKPADRTFSVGKSKHWYKTMDMVYAPKMSMVFLNDKYSSNELAEGKKGDPVKNMSGVSAFVYRIQSDGSFKKEFVFGEPKDKHSLKYCNFYASSYEPVKNIYATIMTDEAQDNKSFVVWLKQ